MSSALVLPTGRKGGTAAALCWSPLSLAITQSYHVAAASGTCLSQWTSSNILGSFLVALGKHGQLSLLHFRCMRHCHRSQLCRGDLHWRRALMKWGWQRAYCPCPQGQDCIRQCLWQNWNLTKICLSSRLLVSTSVWMLRPCVKEPWHMMQHCALPGFSSKRSSRAVPDRGDQANAAAARWTPKATLFKCAHGVGL